MPKTFNHVHIGYNEKTEICGLTADQVRIIAETDLLFANIAEIYAAGVLSVAADRAAEEASVT